MKQNRPPRTRPRARAHTPTPHSRYLDVCPYRVTLRARLQHQTGGARMERRRDTEEKTRETPHVERASRTASRASTSDATGRLVRCRRHKTHASSWSAGTPASMRVSCSEWSHASVAPDASRCDSYAGAWWARCTTGASTPPPTKPSNRTTAQRRRTSIPDIGIPIQPTRGNDRRAISYARRIERFPQHPLERRELPPATNGHRYRKSPSCSSREAFPVIRSDTLIRRRLRARCRR